MHQKLISMSDGDGRALSHRQRRVTTQFGGVERLRISAKLERRSFWSWSSRRWSSRVNDRMHTKRRDRAKARARFFETRTIIIALLKPPTFASSLLTTIFDLPIAQSYLFTFIMRPLIRLHGAQIATVILTARAECLNSNIVDSEVEIRRHFA